MAKTSLKIKQSRKQKFSTREYTRCKICGRPHAYLRKYGICRICFRELAYKEMCIRDSPMRINKVKKDIARVKTVIRERELNINVE